MQNTKKMETVSKKNEAETEDVRILREETKKALKTLYSIGTDAEEFKALPLSESTRAAIYARRKVSDALESLFVLHRIMYCVDDEESANKILERHAGWRTSKRIHNSLHRRQNGGNWKRDMIMDKELITKDNVSNVGNIQISEETKALISCRAKLSDIYETVANVIGRLYGDTDMDNVFDGFSDSFYAFDEYLLNAIIKAVELKSLSSRYKLM